MNTVNPYLKQYQKNQIETATPEQILILLYDGAIQYLIKARAAMEEKNFELMHNSFIACQNIILEFMHSLDMESGGDVAKNLYSLYDYLYRTLTRANVKKDLEKVDEVMGHLKSLRETWKKAIAISNAEKNTMLIDDEPRAGIDIVEDFE